MKNDIKILQFYDYSFRFLLRIESRVSHNFRYIPRITIQEYPSRRVSVRVVSVSPTAIERRSIPVAPLDVE